MEENKTMENAENDSSIIIENVIVGPKSIKHAYDIDLKSLLRNYQKAIYKVELDTAVKESDLIDGIKFLINDYCRYNEIDFNKEVQILIKPEEGGAYTKFLASSLVFYADHKIRQYLNYHKKLYEKEKNVERPFTGLIEFIIVDMVDLVPFDNSKRLNTIMRWVEDESKRKYPSKDKPVIQPPPSGFKLIWIDGKFPMLRSISRGLHQKKFTYRQTDFSDVFNYSKKIRWRKDIASWSYLISKLNEESNCYMTTHLGANPYYSVSREFFVFGDDLKEIPEETNLSSTAYNFKERTTENQKKTKAELDLILKEALDTVTK